MYNKKNNGFTLIEMLVVIAIISILTGAILLNLHSTQAKATDATRKIDMRQIKTALELYYFDHAGTYPITGEDPDNPEWWGVSENGGSKDTKAPNAYIPGIEAYLAELPIDPKGIKTGWSGYLYKSNGIDYKLLCHATGPESFPSEGQPLYDPIRPKTAWMICSGGDACGW
jgi:prepilin-type N-terminal cleavage/methylation domain-containing protein